MQTAQVQGFQAGVLQLRSLVIARWASLTLTLVFEHSAKVDVTLTGKEFKITKGRAESLTWRKQTKVYSSGEITHAQLLAGVQGSKTGYTIKTVNITNHGGMTSARVTGSGRAAKITSYNKVGTFTLTLVLQHDTKEDVTLRNAAFEITKANAESLSWTKQKKHFIPMAEKLPMPSY